MIWELQIIKNEAFCLHSCRLPGFEGQFVGYNPECRWSFYRQNRRRRWGGGSMAKPSEIAPKGPQWSERGFGCRVGWSPYSSFIIKPLGVQQQIGWWHWSFLCFGFHFSNSPSFKGPGPASHQVWAYRLISDLCSDHNGQRKRRYSTRFNFFLAITSGGICGSNRYRLRRGMMFWFSWIKEADVFIWWRNFINVFGKFPGLRIWWSCVCRDREWLKSKGQSYSLK